MRSSILQGDAGAGTRPCTILETGSPWSSRRQHPRSNVHTDAADVAVAQLDSAGVQPRPTLDPQPTQLLGKRGRAADRPHRAVDHGQDAVAGALDQPAVDA